MANPENIIGKGFDKNPQNINREGRPPSIKNQLKEIVAGDGNMIFSKEDIIKTHSNGSVEVSVPTQLQLALKLTKIAMSKKGNESLKAIQMIMEQIDGKPQQNLKMEGIKVGIDADIEETYV